MISGIISDGRFPIANAPITIDGTTTVFSSSNGEFSLSTTPGSVSILTWGTPWHYGGGLTFLPEHASEPIHIVARPYVFREGRLNWGVVDRYYQVEDSDLWRGEHTRSKDGHTSQILDARFHITVSETVEDVIIYRTTEDGQLNQQTLFEGTLEAGTTVIDVTEELQGRFGSKGVGTGDTAPIRIIGCTPAGVDLECTVQWWECYEETERAKCRTEVPEGPVPDWIEVAALRDFYTGKFYVDLKSIYNEIRNPVAPVGVNSNYVSYFWGGLSIGFYLGSMTDTTPDVNGVSAKDIRDSVPEYLPSGDIVDLQIWVAVVAIGEEGSNPFQYFYQTYIYGYDDEGNPDVFKGFWNGDEVIELEWSLGFEDFSLLQKVDGSEFGWYLGENPRAILTLGEMSGEVVLDEEDYSPNSFVDEDEIGTIFDSWTLYSGAGAHGPMVEGVESFRISIDDYDLSDINTPASDNRAQAIGTEESWTIIPNTSFYTSPGGYSYGFFRTADSALEKYQAIIDHPVIYDAWVYLFHQLPLSILEVVSGVPTKVQVQKGDESWVDFEWIDPTVSFGTGRTIWNAKEKNYYKPTIIGIRAWCSATGIEIVWKSSCAQSSQPGEGGSTNAAIPVREVVTPTIHRAGLKGRDASHVAAIMDATRIVQPASMIQPPTVPQLVSLRPKGRPSGTVVQRQLEISRLLNNSMSNFANRQMNVFGQQGLTNNALSRVMNNE